MNERLNASWIPGLFLLLPIAALGYGAFLGVSSYLLGLDSEPADGLVVAIEKEINNDGDAIYRPIVAYEVGKDRFQCKGEVGFNIEFYTIGDRVVVRYERDHPEIAYIDSFLQRWLIPLFYVLVGALFAVPSLLDVLRHTKATRNDPAIGR